MEAAERSRVCIIGAGVSGLAATKVFVEDGFAVDVYEKASDLGGTWHRARTYPALRTNDPKELYCFSDLAYPEEADEFPTAEQVRDYLESYADHFRLRRHMRLSTEVTEVARLSGREGRFGSRFRVRVVPRGGEAEVHDYDHVVVCNGVFSKPKVPRIDGAERFTGTLMHSSELSSLSQIASKRVVVVGGGKSAYDCAKVAADHAVRCALVFRTPHWLGPRYILGLREDWLVLTRAFQAFLPYHTKRGLAALLHGPGQPLVRLFWRFQTWIVKRVMDPPPELDPDEALPIGFRNIGSGTEVYDQARSGRLTPIRSEVESFVGDRTIRLRNGELVDADVIIFATGWEQHVDMLSDELRSLVFRDGFFTLYRHILPPEEPGIGFIGYASSIGNTLTSEISAHWLASCFRGALSLPDRSEMHVEIEKVRAWLERWLPGCAGGHLIAPYLVDHADELVRDMGLSVRQADNLVEEYLGRFHPVRFRGIGRQRRERARASE